MDTKHATAPLKHLVEASENECKSKVMILLYVCDKQHLSCQCSVRATLSPVKQQFLCAGRRPTMHANVEEIPTRAFLAAHTCIISRTCTLTNTKEYPRKSCRTRAVNHMEISSVDPPPKKKTYFRLQRAWKPKGTVCPNLKNNEVPESNRRGSVRAARPQDAAPPPHVAKTVVGRCCCTKTVFENPDH